MARVPELDPRERTTILAHYYRAMVGRADVWRTRMDSTTHWAIGTTAAVVSFSLGNAAVPHYVVFIGSLLTLCFLGLEARRLTFYHLWQQRVLLLERGLVGPALEANEPDPALAAQLAPHLGRTVPSMPIWRAAARRLRRIYMYLFGVQALAWLLKLAIEPGPAGSARELIERAAAGPVPGAVLVAVAAALLLGAATLALALGGVAREAHA